MYVSNPMITEIRPCDIALCLWNITCECCPSTEAESALDFPIDQLAALTYYKYHDALVTRHAPLKTFSQRNVRRRRSWSRDVPPLWSADSEVSMVVWRRQLPPLEPVIRTTYWR